RSLQRPPVFAEVPGGAFNVSEAAPAGSLVGAVRVQPPDSRLRLASPQLGLPFSLHPASGLLLTAGPLDYEARSHYLLVLVATDTVSGLAATASVAVNILDVNDSPPTCSAVAEVALSAAEASAAVAADSPILRGRPQTRTKARACFEKQKNCGILAGAAGDCSVFSELLLLALGIPCCFFLQLLSQQVRQKRIRSRPGRHRFELLPEMLLLFQSSARPVAGHKYRRFQCLLLAPLSAVTRNPKRRFAATCRSPPLIAAAPRLDCIIESAIGIPRSRHVPRAAEAGASSAISGPALAMPAVSRTQLRPAVFSARMRRPRCAAEARLPRLGIPGPVFMKTDFPLSGLSDGPGLGRNGAASVSLRLAWGSPESLPLRLNSVTGELYLTGPPQPDGASWQFDVEASDGVHTAACRVSVAVAAAPTRTDTPPNSTAEVTVAENSPPGEIFAWQCRFHGNSTPIQYTLAGDIGSSFGLVEKTSGRLRLLKALDREAAAAHSLRLSCACSRPSGPAAATLDLSVLVADENDNSPTFAASSASAVTIARNLPADAPVAQLTATDPDADENGTVAFLLLSHTETFYVDSATGQVRLRSAASDLQGVAGFEVWAEARDRGRLWRSARRLLNVSLAAADICAPVFQQPDFTFWVEEALPSSQLPAFVGRAAATDCDSPALLYQSLDDSVPFSVTTDGGLVRATSAVDRESRPLPFVFTVQAFDNSSPRKSASATVSVSVADRNDNRPRCAWRLAFHLVAEDAPVGLEVGQLVATDSDLGENARLEFGLVDGDGTFAINATNGRLTLRAPLDREQRAEHNLRVRVTDFGAPRLSADCRVRVSVADVNDNSPLSAAAGAFELNVLATETRVSQFFLPCPLIGRPLLCSQQLQTGFSMQGGSQGDNGAAAEGNSGALVGGVRAWDPDAGANGSVTYSLVAGGDSDSVQLDSADSSSGFIYLRRSLDGAAPGSLLSFTVDATDGGGRRTPLPVRLRVLAAPADAALAVAGFANHPAVISVVEGLAEPGRPLANLTAVTGASVAAGSVRYQLLALSRSLSRPSHFQSGLFNADLSVNFLTGQLTVAAPLDSGQVSEYRAVVRAFIPANPGAFATTILTVRVAPSSASTAPSFSRPVFEFELAENLPPPQPLGSLRAAGSGAVRFALVGDSGPFAIDAATGELTTTAQLDREARDTWELNCSVADAATGRVTDFADVHIRVLDDNDRQPFGTSAYFKASVLEDSPVGTRVLQISATDGDTPEFAWLRFSLTSNPDGKFAMDPVSGWVSVADGLDREAQGLYRLGFSVTDGKFSYDSEAEITVGDVNDNAPQFLAANYSFLALPDVQAGSKWGKAGSKWEQAGSKWEQAGSKWGKAGSKWEQAGSKWEQAGSNKWGKAGSKWEQAGSKWGKRQQGSKRAASGNKRAASGKSGQQVGSKGSKWAASENKRAASGNKRAASENKRAASGNKRAASGSKWEQAGSKWEQAGSKWEQAGSKWEQAGSKWESGSKWEQAGSKWEQAGSKWGKAGSKWEQAGSKWGKAGSKWEQAGSSQERSPPSPQAPAAIGSVSATDADQPGSANARLTLSLSGPGSDLFAVDSATGQLSTRQRLQAGAEFPALLLTARDGGRPQKSATASLTVRVLTAELPVMNASELTLPIPVTLGAGQSLVRVGATFSQEGPAGGLTFSLVGGNGSDWLSLDASTGWVSLRRALDSAMAGQRLQLLVGAASTANAAVKAQRPTRLNFVLTLPNSHGPVIAPGAYQASVAETAGPGTLLFSIDVSDGDSGINGQGAHAITQVDLSIQRVTPSLGLELRIDPAKAGAYQLLLASGSGLDFERARSHSVSLLAADRAYARRTADAALTLLVVDVNDSPPRFASREFFARVAENSPAGHALLNLSASDADDSPANSQISFGIAAADGNASSTPLPFATSPSSGLVSTTGPLDFEARSWHRLVATAWNPGSSGVTTASASVYVEVGSENEFAPQPEPPSLQLRLRPGVDSPGKVLGRVRASDADAGPAGRLRFALVAADPSAAVGLVTVNHDTGHVVVAAVPPGSPAAAVRSRCTLTVQVSNPGPYRDALVAQVPVRIDIDDGNDPPVFAAPAFTAAISEAVPVGANVTRAIAEDPDSAPGDRDFRFALAEATEAPFSVDPATGQYCSPTTPVLHFLDHRFEPTARPSPGARGGPLDRETRPRFNLTLLAIDSGSPALTATARLLVTLTDVNDSGPRFEPAVPRLVVQEGLWPGAIVGRLAEFATDPDELGHGAPFSFRPVADDRFTVGADGLVVTKATLDREALQVAQLAVVVTDVGGVSATLTFQVEIADVNDNPSSSRPQSLLVSAYQGLPPRGPLARLLPTDLDTSGSYQCALLTGPPGLLLADTCEVYLLSTASLQADVIYQLTVRQHDGRHPAVVSDLTLTLQSVGSEALASSVVLALSASPAAAAAQWTQLSQAVLRSLPSGAQPLLVSLAATADAAALRVAFRKSSGQPAGFLSTETVVAALSKPKASTDIKALTGLSLVAVETRFCTAYPCKRPAAWCSFAPAADPQAPSAAFEAASVGLAAPSVSDVETCSCPAGAAGPGCGLSTAGCAAGFCQNGGLCFSEGGALRCLCGPQFTGDRCQFGAQRCRSSPCRNGGACQEMPGSDSGFACACPAGWAGRLCETPANLCDTGGGPSRCQNGGTCLPAFNDFRCSCTFGFYGNACETAAWGFYEGSHAALRLRHPAEFSLDFELAMAADSALLLLQPLSDSAWLSLQFGSGRLSASLHQDGRLLLSESLAAAFIGKTAWTRLSLARSGRLLTVSATRCGPSASDACPACQSTSCRLSLNLTDSAAALGTGQLLLGGLPASLRRLPPGLAAFDFVGCLRRLSPSAGDFDNEAASYSGVSRNSCPRPDSPPCSAPGVCGGSGVGARCVDEWWRARCDCPAGRYPPACSPVLTGFSLGAGSQVVYTQRPSYLRAKDGSVGRRRRRRDVSSTLPSPSAGWSTLALKAKANGLTANPQLLLVSRSSATQFTMLLLSSAGLRVVSVNNSARIDATHPATLSAGRPISVSLARRSSTGDLSLGLDSAFVSVGGAGSGSHDFLGDDVVSLGLGSGVGASLDGRALAAFTGCAADLRLDGEPLPIGAGLTARFSAAVVGSVAADCPSDVCLITDCPRGFQCTENPAVWGDASCSRTGGLTDDQLKVAIAVPGVLGVLLLSLLVLLFAVLRRRYRAKAKASAAASSTSTMLEPRLQTQHRQFVYSTPQSRDAIGSTKSNQDSGFSESALIRQHIRAELEAVRAARHFASGGEGGDSTLDDDNEDDPYELGPAEQYDLENASSIAASDVDALRHYRNLRAAAAMPRLPEDPAAVAAAAGSPSLQSRVYERCGSAASSDDYGSARRGPRFPFAYRQQQLPPPAATGLTLEDIRRLARRGGSPADAVSCSDTDGASSGPPPPPPPPLPPGRVNRGFQHSGSVGDPLSDSAAQLLHGASPSPPLQQQQLESLIGWSPSVEFQRLAPVFSDLGCLPHSHTQEEFLLLLRHQWHDLSSAVFVGSGFVSGRGSAALPEVVKADAGDGEVQQAEAQRSGPEHGDKHALGLAGGVPGSSATASSCPALRQTQTQTLAMLAVIRRMRRLGRPRLLSMGAVRPPLGARKQPRMRLALRLSRLHGQPAFRMANATAAPARPTSAVATPVAAEAVRPSDLSASEKHLQVMLRPVKSTHRFMLRPVKSTYKSMLRPVKSTYKSILVAGGGTNEGGRDWKLRPGSGGGRVAENAEDDGEQKCQVSGAKNQCEQEKADEVAKSVVFAEVALLTVSGSERAVEFHPEAEQNPTGHGQEHGGGGQDRAGHGEPRIVAQLSVRAAATPAEQQRSQAWNRFHGSREDAEPRSVRVGDTAVCQQKKAEGDSSESADCQTGA
uniref:Cadherin domain-containing protein n=1 Tax=Macrostomum lignano TaxID=282301 RepID=A0A1I8I8X1_9PLAT